MHDIYHLLVKHSQDFERCSDDGLAIAGDTYADASFAITSALTVIGNLTLDALFSEGYSDELAKRDLTLIANTLRHLPRMAQALEQNSDTASFVLRSRRGEE